MGGAYSEAVPGGGQMAKDIYGRRCYDGRRFYLAARALPDITATVLLPTYNGASHLGELLDSVLAQDYRPLRIVARDDGSSDDSRDILAGYAERHPDIITVLQPDSGENRGAQANFAALMKAAVADSTTNSCYLFCDQDDIWHPNKISRLLDAISDSDPSKPALAYCDMVVVAEDGRQLAPSFLAYQQLSTDASLRSLLVQNHVSGCACLFNRAALELAYPLPAEALMHDWWVALLSRAQGSVSYCSDALVDYRQHGNNLVGAPGARIGSLLMRGLDGQGTSLAQLYAQAEALRERLHSQGFEPAQDIVNFCQSSGMRQPARALHLVRNGYTRRGWLRNLPMLLGRSLDRS